VVELRSGLIVPRPEQPLKISLGTGGSPASVYRAAQLEIPIFFRILGGTPEHWGQYCHSYRDAWLKAGHSVDAGDLAVFVGDIRQLIDLKCFVSLCKFLAFRLEFARHPPDANPVLYAAFIVILKILLLSLRYLIILLYYSLLIQHMIQNE